MKILRFYVFFCTVSSIATYRLPQPTLRRSPVVTISASNVIRVKAPVKSAKNSLVSFLENNAVLKEVNQQFGANYLSKIM